MTRITTLLLAIGLATALGAQAPPASVAPSTARGEWPTYGGDLASTKYSPLDQITAANFGSLKLAWRAKSPDGFLSLTLADGSEWSADSKLIFDELSRLEPRRWRDGQPPFVQNYKATPLMVNGTVYVNTAASVGAAYDARTGALKWVYNPKSYESGTTTLTLRWNQRGVAYWTDGKDERIYWGTGDGYLICVDAKTGKPVAGFGQNGKVDLMEGLPRAKRGTRDYLNALTYSVQSPPIVVRDMIITPAAISSLIKTKEQIPGWLRAFDVRTGKVRWTFQTVPPKGEFGSETWSDGSNEYAGKVTVWTMMSADEELGQVYLPTNTTAPDFYGAHRLGNNLFAESIVALDLATGKRVWHFQTVHHGLWDYDNPAAPNLLDITVDGKRIKALAQITKQGYVYTFDRVTGVPVWPIVETPVAASDVAGEKASPTQPIPSKPAPFEYQGSTVDELVDFTRRRDQGDRRIPDRPLVHPAVATGHHRSSRHHGWRQLAGRRRRSGDRPDVCAVAKRLRRVEAGCAGSRSREQPALHATAGTQSDHARWPAAVQAAVLAPHRHQHEHRRSRVDGASRKRRSHPQQPAAQGPEPAAGRRRQHVQRPAVDEDAVDLRLDDGRHDRWTAVGGL